MERENAEMGLLITLEPPTRPMTDEATAAGFYVPEAFPDRQFPRVQIATVEDILNGNGPAIPQLGLSQSPTFRRAPRQRRAQSRRSEPPPLAARFTPSVSKGHNLLHHSRENGNLDLRKRRKHHSPEPSPLLRQRPILSKMLMWRVG